MAAAAVDNPPAPVAGESKSARKKKAKTEASTSANGIGSVTPVVPVGTANDSSAALDVDGSSEHAYLREISKQIRNINKKLSGTQKTDSIIAENPGVSLDELVAQRKINADQKASAQKKPQLQAQLAQLEEQAEHYRKFDAEYQQKLSQQKESLAAEHAKELDKIRQDARREAKAAGDSDLRQKLLTFSQFLRAAAHKRTIEEEADTDESKAFEGALLLVYGGDSKAVDTAISLIDGSDAQVPSIEGIPLPINFSQVKKASIDHAPYQAEEAWVDQVAEATSGDAHPAAGPDPTIANAGLTELDAGPQTNGVSTNDITETTSVLQTSAGEIAGNTAGERWDTSAGAETGGLEDSYEVIPRPADEVDVHATATQQIQGTSWADETIAHEAATTGNQVGENWDTKVAGDQTDKDWAATPTQSTAATGNASAPADDGFHEVSGRHRGRGRGRGNGEFRGNGGTRRGNFRGRGPRGGRGGEGGEGRGGRGGGRGGGGQRGGSSGGGHAAQS